MTHVFLYVFFGIFPDYIFSQGMCVFYCVDKQSLAFEIMVIKKKHSLLLELYSKLPFSCRPEVTFGFAQQCKVLTAVCGSQLFILEFCDINLSRGFYVWSTTSITGIEVALLFWVKCHFYGRFWNTLIPPFRAARHQPQNTTIFA